MLVLGVILLVIGLVLALAPGARAASAALGTVGWILVVFGVVLILVDLLDVGDANAAGAMAVPLSTRVRDRLVERKHRMNRWLDMRALDLARLLPARLRMWVVVDSTNTARLLYPDPSGYAGPDGLTYGHIYDGALRTRTPLR